jgi:nitrate reductase NapAB chaperone NapD
VSVRRALLVIADIGGYTPFMKAHKASLAHAQDIVARLLEAVIDAAPHLRLLEIEGDAAFFYAWPPEGGDAESARILADEIVAMHRAFHTVRQRINTLNACSCEGCRGARKLTVKFVAHFGEVALQRVKHVSKLAGLDVILVHRMLKNTVPVPEYALLSERLFHVSDEKIRTRSVPLPQEFEGLGQVQTYFVDISEIAEALPPRPEPTLLGRIVETGGVIIRSLPYLIGVRKPRFAL